MSRVITEQDKANAQRLKAIYNAKKKQLGITQTDLAKQIGMKQGAAAQYINGHIALNYEAVIRFAKALQVDPWDIDPELDILSAKGEVTSREVAVDVEQTLSNSGKPPKRKSVTIRYNGMPDYLIGFEADSNAFAPFLKEGDVAIVDRNLQPEVGDDVVITFNSGALTVGELREQSAKAITVTSYTSGEERTRSMDEIKSYDVVVEISKPVKHRARRLQRA